MPSVATWKRLGAVSGLSFGIFLIFHLISHYSLIVGFETAQDNLLKFRTFYQHPVAETLLFGSLVLHMISNTIIYLKRRKTDAAIHKKHEDHHLVEPSKELQAHRYAGYVIALFIVGHVFGARVAPLLFLEDPSMFDYSFIVAVNQKLPYNLLATFLLIFGLAAGWHLVYGTTSALAILSGSSIHGKPFPFLLKPLVVFMHLLIFNAVLGLAGYYYVVDMSKNVEAREQYLEDIGL